MTMWFKFVKTSLKMSTDTIHAGNNRAVIPVALSITTVDKRMNISSNILASL